MTEIKETYISLDEELLIKILDERDERLIKKLVELIKNNQAKNVNPDQV